MPRSAPADQTQNLSGRKRFFATVCMHSHMPYSCTPAFAAHASACLLDTLPDAIPTALLMSCATPTHVCLVGVHVRMHCADATGACAHVYGLLSACAALATQALMDEFDLENEDSSGDEEEHAHKEATLAAKALDLQDSQSPSVLPGPGSCARTPQDMPAILMHPHLLYVAT
jgi:hypothetical protein